MKVHFSASLRDLDKHFETYELIEKTIKTNGHEIAKEWLKEYRQRSTNRIHFSDKQWEDISSATLSAVQSADAVIVEASVPSFSMGYISAIALSRKKPLLMLFNSQPQPYILDSNNSLRRAEVYRNVDELQKAVASFLKDVDVDGNNLRFNMVLDREVYNFLNWESVNSGKTKAQIVREVLKERIRRKD
jgi:hypothetical protein